MAHSELFVFKMLYVFAYLQNWLGACEVARQHMIALIEDALGATDSPNGG